MWTNADDGNFAVVFINHDAEMPIVTSDDLRMAVWYALHKGSTEIALIIRCEPLR